MVPRLPIACACERTQQATPAPASSAEQVPPLAEMAASPPQAAPVEALEHAVEQWHKALPAGSLMTLIDALQGVKGRTLCVGTGFSGCEIAWKALSLLKARWETSFEISLSFNLAFSCESDPDKQRWLLEQPDAAPRLFRDMAELQSTKAFCMRTRTRELVPFVDIFLGGFVCTSRSPLNKNRGTLMHCVQRQLGKTGASFSLVEKYVAANKPTMCVLENVPGLMQRQAHGDVSDAQYIRDRFESMGYQVSMHLYDAATHGSIAPRERLWIIAILGEGPAVAKSLLAAHSTMMATRIPTLAPDHNGSRCRWSFWDLHSVLFLQCLVPEK